MEIIIIIVIVLVCCLILNVDPNFMLLGSTLVMCIFFGLLALGFTYCTINLVRSKRKEANFLHFDKVGESRYQVAYYLVEGQEYPCIFPKEIIMQDKLYLTDMTYYVRLNKRMGKVYDRFAVTTCILGLILSIGFSIGMLLFYFTIR